MAWLPIAVGAVFGAIGGGVGDPVWAALIGGAAAGLVMAAGALAERRN